MDSVVDRRLVGSVSDPEPPPSATEEGGGEENVEESSSSSCGGAHRKTACMPLNEEIDGVKNNSEWKNRKSLSTEKYKEELINQAFQLEEREVECFTTSIDNPIEPEVFLDFVEQFVTHPSFHLKVKLNNSSSDITATHGIPRRCNAVIGPSLYITPDGKCLCGHYIRARLRRTGALNRKVVQRLRVILEPSSSVVYEVFPALNCMGEEIERLHPRLYTNVSRQLSVAPFGELSDGDTAPMLLNLVAKELFKTNITWGKIVSLFSVCGGFAIDCVRQDHYDYLQYLIDGMSEIIEDDLVHWLADNGGWLGLLKHIRPHETKYSFLSWLTMFVIVSSAIYLITNMVKHLGCHLYSFLFQN